MTQPDLDVLQTLQTKPHKTRNRLLWGGGILLGLLALGALFAPKGGGEAPYETATVDRGDLVMGVTAVGVLEPTLTAEVGSDQSGTIARVFVSENDTVTEGQVLAELDPRSLDLQVQSGEARVAQMEASLATAELTAKEARKEAERSARMKEKGASSQAEDDLAQVNTQKADASLQLVRAQLKEARLALSLARRNREESTIISPIAGTVLTRNVEPGQTVVSALQAATLFQVAADLTEMRLPVEVDEAEVGRVKPGQKATFTVPAWVGRTFEATVEKVHIAPKPNVAVVSYVAELKVANDDMALRPGMTATARLVTEEARGVLTVPTEALRFEPQGQEPPEGSHVWVLEDGKPKAVAVKAGGNDGQRVAVEGLTEGATVVLEEKGAKKFGPPGQKK